MTEDDLIKVYPRLWHMAHDGAWPALQAQGLKSAKALVDSFEITGKRREELLRARRRESVQIEHPKLPAAVLRDQKPMDDKRLSACLEDDLTPADWYELLNSYSFFWLSRSRIWSLLRARAYRDIPQTVLTLNTASLVASHRPSIRLSPLNSGATLFKPQPRGLRTFSRVEDFPFSERAKTRPIKNNVVELVVEHSVPDLKDHVLAVHRVRNDKILEQIWKRPGTSDSEHP